ncbi:Rho GTPase activation protein with PH domain, putative isoform 2 [Hibiscus syriacus]|uniref:Rho GTPase activation protein with PH domain, putative isoform 2 n=1 Tax=Hibiscus syriacus TaxID=106335 RepID=A0A6A2Z0A7_HIBSY|nr:Rho GTPase activation protein with PH domain, putative isoform 2 [Hibiscus syriacus]
MMMQTVASHKSENLMSSSAVAACMAPLLLLPLLSGDCEIETDFDVGADNSSMQLLQAAAAANHAQTIVMTLLEHYDKIFGEGCVSSEFYSDSEETESESEEEADDDGSYEDDECEDESQGSDDDNNSAESGTGSESGQSVKSGDDKTQVVVAGVGGEQSAKGKRWVAEQPAPRATTKERRKKEDSESSSSSSATETNKPNELSKPPVSSATKPPVVGNGPGHQVTHSTVRGRSSGSKTVSMGFTDLPCEEEAAVESLESEKSDLQKRLTEEIEGNTILEANLEKRKRTLHEQRLALEKEVARLEEELQRAREKRMALEAGINPSQGPASPPIKLEEKLVQSFRVNSSSSALTKLTNGLNNLMKELRSQTENETAGMEKGSGSSQAAPSSSDKGKGAETIKTVKKGDKGRGAEPIKSVKNP